MGIWSTGKNERKKKRLIENLICVTGTLQRRGLRRSPPPDEANLARGSSVSQHPLIERTVTELPRTHALSIRLRARAIPKSVYPRGLSSETKYPAGLARCPAGDFCFSRSSISALRRNVEKDRGFPGLLTVTRGRCPSLEALELH